MLIGAECHEFSNNTIKKWGCLPTKTHYRKDIRQFWELGPEIFTIERFLEGAEDYIDKIFTSAADRQVGPAENTFFRLQ